MAPRPAGVSARTHAGGRRSAFQQRLAVHRVVLRPAGRHLDRAQAVAQHRAARQWPALQQIITRSAGKPSVAPESDKREALVLRTADDFETVDEGADLV